MSQDLVFLDFSGLEDHLKNELLIYLCPLSKNPEVELPWDLHKGKINAASKGDGSYLNVFAPAFQSAIIPNSYVQKEVLNAMPCLDTYSNGLSNPLMVSDFVPASVPNSAKYHLPSDAPEVSANGNYLYQESFTANDKLENCSSNCVALPEECSGQVNLGPRPGLPFQGSVSTFKLSPTVSSFVPQKLPAFTNQVSGPTSEEIKCAESSKAPLQQAITENDISETVKNVPSAKSTESNANNSSDASNSTDCSNNIPTSTDCANNIPTSTDCANNIPSSNELPKSGANCVSQVVASQSPRTFADVLKSKSDSNRTTSMLPVVKKPLAMQQNTVSVLSSSEDSEGKKSCVKEDKMAILLGRHLFESKLEFLVTNLQPRGLINRRNWCYINATLQALLACSPFYSLLRNLPLGPGVERGKSSTPVIDSMVKLSYEFIKIKEEVEDLQPGVPFQPLTVYNILGMLKPDCLRGQQEDAEEFLSFILNGMHEEMASVIKNYEDRFNLNEKEGVKANGHADGSDTEDEWQVIGVKQRCMVTRKVVEHKTPISDMLGGQIKSILTTNGNRTSASVQPFFTMQLDIQSDNVNCVEDALNQMTVQEPVQGYTCAKTKQEVEAYSRIMLQKLPPVLILHLKRFVYFKQWDGGCKKVLKHIQYPITLEFKKELFTPEARKMKRPSPYKLFAVIYHDGSEAILGHYICDIYHSGSKCWLRCDDRAITTINEAQVLSHSPPRVPYLLFYQACNPEQVNGD